MKFSTMAEIWALDHECASLFGTCRACEQIWREWDMATIEDRHAELAEMVEAAVDPTRQAHSADEIMEKARAAMMAVLEEVVMLGFPDDDRECIYCSARPGDPHRNCYVPKFAARFAALGKSEEE